MNKFSELLNGTVMSIFIYKEKQNEQIDRKIRLKQNKIFT